MLGVFLLQTENCLARTYKHYYDSCCQIRMDLPKKWKTVRMKPSARTGLEGLATFIKLHRHEKCYQSSEIRLWTFRDEKYFKNFIPDTAKKDSTIQIILMKADRAEFIRPCYHTYDQNSFQMVLNFIYKYKGRFFVLECMSHMQYADTNYPSFVKLAESVRFD